MRVTIQGDNFILYRNKRKGLVLKLSEIEEFCSCDDCYFKTVNRCVKLVKYISGTGTGLPCDRIMKDKKFIFIKYENNRH